MIRKRSKKLETWLKGKDDLTFSFENNKKWKCLIYKKVIKIVLVIFGGIRVSIHENVITLVLVIFSEHS